MTLSSLWNSRRELFGGLSGEVFPLLIKIIDEMCIRDRCINQQSKAEPSDQSEDEDRCGFNQACFKSYFKKL